MTIEEAKSIRIADYLHSLGYSPVKQQGINLWYKSPFREESEASFKVNTEREQWYDFGLGKGGNIIALAAHLYATDHVPYILKRIAEQTPHVRPISFSFGKQSSSEPSFQHLEIVPLSSPALLAYLQGRGINTELAKRECSEARFTHNGANFSKKEYKHIFLYVRILFDYISYFANVFISSSIFSTKSSSFIAPTSPSFLLRTPTSPASCSLSPTTSMYGTF